MTPLCVVDPVLAARQSNEARIDEVKTVHAPGVALVPWIKDEGAIINYMAINAN